MKPARKSAGRQLKSVDFPELDKVSYMQPVEEFRPARRMFGFHKNMHSPGFCLGSNQVAKRYMEKAINELRKKQKQVEGVDESHRSLSSSRTVDESRELTRLKFELKKKEAELTDMKTLNTSGVPAPPKLRPTPRRMDLSSSLPREVSMQRPELPPTHVRDKSVVETLKVTEWREPEPPAKERVKSESPYSTSRYSPTFAPTATPLRLLPKYTPTARNDTSKIHELAALPIFQAEQYTKKKPKLHSENPITGKSQTGLAGGYTMKDGSSSPTRKRGLAGYGSILVGQ